MCNGTNGCKECKCSESIKITDLSQVVCELNGIYTELENIDHAVTEELSLRVKKCINTILKLVDKPNSKYPMHN